MMTGETVEEDSIAGPKDSSSGIKFCPCQRAPWLAVTRVTTGKEPAVLAVGTEARTAGAVATVVVLVALADDDDSWAGARTWAELSMFIDLYTFGRTWEVMV